MTRIHSVSMLAPSMENAIGNLMDWLSSHDRETEWMIFETYRTPADQYANLVKGVSRSKPFLSAHQHGLAADIVPYVKGKPTWPPVSDPCWTRLDAGVKAVGLTRPLASWDASHVQHPVWPEVLAVMKTIIDMRSEG